jgi:hypothetical protein
MPGDIIKITPEPDPRSKSQPAAFADQYAAIRAEIALQNSDQALRGHSPSLSGWFALAVASGAAVALGFVYFLAR